MLRQVVQRHFSANTGSDYRYVTYGNVNGLAFAPNTYYLRANRPHGVRRIRLDKATQMDDSREMESSVAQVWAAEPSENDHPTAKAVFTIGELSRDFGVTLRALRFYENKGLISPQRHGLNRLYSQGDRDRLALILKGKKLGFTLGEIREMIAAEEGTADTRNLALSREKCLEQIALLQKQKAELEEGLSELYRIQAQLAGTTAEKDRRTG
jgi:DNA-binding transcriptional MerR regulator